MAGGGACKSETGSDWALGVESSNDNGLLAMDVDDADAEFDEVGESGSRARVQESKLHTKSKGQLSAREMRRVAGETARMARSSRILATERRNRREVREASMTVKTEEDRQRVLAMRAG